MSEAARTRAVWNDEMPRACSPVPSWQLWAGMTRGAGADRDPHAFPLGAARAG